MKLKLEIQGIFDEADLDASIKKICDNNATEKIKTNRFSGMEIVIYLITFGSGVTIATIANTTKIINDIIEKNKIKSVKIDNIELKGYSCNDVEKLLKKIFSHQDQKNGKEDEKIE